MPENPVFDMDEVKKNSFHSDETVGGKSAERGDVGTLVLGRRGLVLVGVFVVALCLFVGMLVYFLRPDCHSYQSPAVSHDESVTMTSSAFDDVTTLRSYDPCLTSGQGCINGE